MRWIPEHTPDGVHTICLGVPIPVIDRKVRESRGSKVPRRPIRDIGDQQS